MSECVCVMMTYINRVSSRIFCAIFFLYDSSSCYFTISYYTAHIYTTSKQHNNNLTKLFHHHLISHNVRVH